jgi:4-amino-4-deoxy-L-arabinose transferase-like glycosyltransferase
MSNAASHLSHLREHWPFYLVLALAAGLRAVGLGTLPLDSDEAMHLHPLSAADTLRFDLLANPPLFRLLVQGACAFDRSAAVARLVPMLAGVGTVALLYRVALEESGRLTATLAALLLAVHPWHIRHSQTLRSYSLLVLLVLAGFWALRRRRGRLLCGLSGLACFTHYLGFFPAAAQAVILWKREGLKAGLVAMLGPAVAAMLLGGFVLWGLPQKLAEGLERPSTSIPELLAAMVRCALAPGGLSLLAGVALMAAGFAEARLRPAALTGAFLVAVVLLAGLAIPVEARYMLPALPFALLLLAGGMASMLAATGKWRVVFLPGVALVLAGIIYPLPAYYEGGGDIARTRAAHPDLAHVEFSLEAAVDSLRPEAAAGIPVVVAARGPLHYRLLLELCHGRYPDEARLENREEYALLEGAGFRIFKLEAGGGEPPSFEPDVVEDVSSGRPFLMLEVGGGGVQWSRRPGRGSGP